jgi:hypothetical protein
MEVIEMNCHKNNNQNKKHNPLKHLWMMALCCGLPMILLLVVPLLGIKSAGLNTLLAGIAPFICPIMMLFMIPMMFKSHKQGGCCKSEDSSNGENKIS